MADYPVIPVEEREEWYISGKAIAQAIGHIVADHALKKLRDAGVPLLKVATTNPNTPIPYMWAARKEHIEKYLQPAPAPDVTNGHMPPAVAAPDVLPAGLETTLAALRSVGQLLTQHNNLSQQEIATIEANTRAMRSLEAALNRNADALPQFVAASEGAVKQMRSLETALNHNTDVWNK